MKINENTTLQYRDVNSALHSEIEKTKQRLMEAEQAANLDLKDKLTKDLNNLFAEFFTKNQALAFGLARPYIAASPEYADDYINSARLGMWEAMRKWDPEKGGTFSTFSRPFIKGQLVRAVRANEYHHISQTDFSKRRLVTEAKESLTESLGRTPTVEEIATESGVHERIVRRTLRDKPVSLDTPVGDEGGTIQDMVSNSSVYDDLGEETPLFDRMLEDLNEQELWLILNRSGVLGTFKQSIVEIADELGIGREVLRRAEVRAKSKMMFAKLALESGELPSVDEVCEKTGQPLKTVAPHLKPVWSELRSRWTIVNASKDRGRIKLLFKEILAASAKILSESNATYRDKTGEFVDPSDSFIVFFTAFINWDPRSEIKFPQFVAKEYSRHWKRTTKRNSTAVSPAEIIDAEDLLWNVLIKNKIISM